MASNDLRAAIGELRQIVLTPIRAHDSVIDDTSLASDVVCLTARRSSESDCLSDTDLPALVTRVLGKCQSTSSVFLLLTTD